MIPRFRFRLDPVLDHRERREEMAQQELAQSLSALAAQVERAVAAERAVEAELERLRELMSGAAELHALRAGHDDLSSWRARAAHERASAERLEAVALERRAELVRAGQDREALARLKRSARERHRREELRVEAAALDELATRRVARARRERGVSLAEAMARVGEIRRLAGL